MKYCNLGRLLITISKGVAQANHVLQEVQRKDENMRRIKEVADIKSKTYVEADMETKEEADIKELSDYEKLIQEYGSRVSVRSEYQVKRVIWMKNGCCPDLPVLLTANWIKEDSRWNYSCQCACDGWCTTGCKTPEEAIDHYRRMSDGENLYGGFLNFIV